MPVFAAFAFVLFIVWSSFRPCNRTSEAPKHCLVRLAFGVFVATALLGVLLEVLQLLFLPNRHFDWADIFWMTTGAFAGAFVAWIIPRLSFAS
jgi:VanZ family protein